MPSSLNESNSVKLVYKYKGDEMDIPWTDEDDTKDGLNITVKEIVQAVSKAGKEISRVRVSYHSRNFSEAYPVHELIDTQVQSDEGTFLKLGNVYYEVTPKHDHHLEVNIKFLKILKEHLVGEQFDQFLLPWQRKSPNMSSKL